MAVSLRVLGVPSSAGAHHAGQDLAPAALRRAGLVDRLQAAGLDVTDGGDVVGAVFAADRFDATARNLEAVVGVARAVADAVADEVRAGRVPIVLGGDCTITLGVVAGVQRVLDEVRVAYFDGDADLNAPDRTRSGVLDATGVAHLLGIADTALARIGPVFPMLTEHQLVLLGYDPGDPDSCDETALAERPGLRHYPYETLRADPAGVAREATSALTAALTSPRAGVIVHFDVDAVDSRDLPLANFPHYGTGVDLATAGQILRTLLAAPGLCALVLTEVNPTHDPGGTQVARYVETVTSAIAGALGATSLPSVDSESGLHLVVGGAELIDDLEPLWLALFDHHLSIGAADLPVIERSQSWPRRRALYESMLTDPGAFVLLARRGRRPVGYALVHIRHGADDTWPTGDRLAHIETLALLPEERGAGLGTRLLDAAEQLLAERGIVDVDLDVMTGNARAMEFYRRRGMRPTVTTVLRLGARPSAGTTPS